MKDDVVFQTYFTGGDALQIFYFHKEIDKQLKVFIVFLTSHILDKDLMPELH